MSTAVAQTASQGVITTQMERVHNDKPTATEAPRPREAQTPPPPPPAETGRGKNVDITA